DFKIGDRVFVGGIKPGIIAYIGEVQFSSGCWAGVVLDSAVGKNDGSVNGVRYFMCEPRRGIFSNLSKLSNSNNSSLNVLDININSSVTSPGSAFSTPSQPSVTPLSALPRRKTSVGSNSSHGSGKQLSNDLTNNQTSDSSAANLSSLPFKLGDHVVVSGSKNGIVKFIGEAEFAKGVWVGVDLREPLGKNDGSVAGKRYFQCTPMHGLFAPIHKVEICKVMARLLPTSATPAGIRSQQQQQHRQQQQQQQNFQHQPHQISSHRYQIKNQLSNINNSSNNNLMTASWSNNTNNSNNIMNSRGTLKEKEEHVEQLIKERDLDRSEFIKTAAQVDEMESQLMLMQSEKKKYEAGMSEELERAKELICKLESSKADLKMQLIEEKRKLEDMQFSLEELNIEKHDIQVAIELLFIIFSLFLFSTKL
ncbi:hypothetical protein HELRODRAFT_77374, partial [Helobdella robusta]|uniref:CAP-Gly domain-containing protein n=1 Tax=Helobdella robusta TaxID=6412 RepID=T1G2X0_HELRO